MDSSCNDSSFSESLQWYPGLLCSFDTAGIPVQTLLMLSGREEGISVGHLLLLSDLWGPGRGHWTWVCFCLWMEGREIQGFTVATVAKGSYHLHAWVVEQGLGWPRLSLLCSCQWKPAQTVELGGGWVDLCWASTLLFLWPERTGFSATACWRVQVSGLPST